MMIQLNRSHIQNMRTFAAIALRARCFASRSSTSISTSGSASAETRHETEHVTQFRYMGAAYLRVPAIKTRKFTQHRVDSNISANVAAALLLVSSGAGGLWANDASLGAD
jgi:hypothetical protein